MASLRAGLLAQPAARRGTGRTRRCRRRTVAGAHVAPGGLHLRSRRDRRDRLPRARPQHHRAVRVPSGRQQLLRPGRAARGGHHGQGSQRHLGVHLPAAGPPDGTRGPQARAGYVPRGLPRRLPADLRLLGLLQGPRRRGVDLQQPVGRELAGHQRRLRGLVVPPRQRSREAAPARPRPAGPGGRHRHRRRTRVGAARWVAAAHGDGAGRLDDGERADRRPGRGQGCARRCRRAGHAAGRRAEVDADGADPGARADLGGERCVDVGTRHPTRPADGRAARRPDPRRGAPGAAARRPRAARAVHVAGSGAHLVG